MAKRTISGKDLISLPRTSASETVALITKTITAADDYIQKHGPLPALIDRSLKRLQKSNQDLSAAIIPDSDAGSPEAVAIDRRLDRAWSALLDFLTAWRKLPSEKQPDPQKLSHLFDLLFSDKLAFTRVRFRIQWQESGARLSAVERDGHEATLAQLGGKVFLDEIREAQEAYGKVLGMTEANPEEEKKVRVWMEGAKDALRDYLSKVDAHADPEEPGSEERAAILSEPVRNWEDAPVKKGKGDAVGAEPGGQGTPGG